MKVLSSLISGDEATTLTLAATSWDSLSTTWRRFPTTSHNTTATVVPRKNWPRHVAHATASHIVSPTSYVNTWRSHQGWFEMSLVPTTLS